jgi:hypothetical protein
VGIIEGAVVFLAGILAGRYGPWRRSPQPQENGPSCGCGHHLSFHENGTGCCRFEKRGRAVRYDSGSRAVGWDTERCGCQHYSGPEPYPEYYARDISS